MTYEKLIKLSEDNDIEVIEKPLKGKIKGLYADRVIAINSKIETTAEKVGVIAEELGHHYTTSGNILDQSKVENRKQETKARRWAYERCVGLIDLVQASKEGIRNAYELAEYLGVTEELLNEALNYYKEKYGLYYELDKYIIYFDPIGVFEKWE